MESPVLSFLLAYFSDLRLQCVLTDGDGLNLAALDLGLRNTILKLTDEPLPAPPFSVEEKTVYHITDYYRCNYSFFPLPAEKKFLFVGPYLLDNIEEPDIRRLINMLSIPQELYPQLRDYYYELPRFSEKYLLHGLLRHLYTALFGTENPNIRYFDLKTTESREDFLRLHQFLVPDDPILSMHLLEKRYSIEDLLLDAVAHGNAAKALSFSENLSTTRFSPRSGDALRDYKNLTITLNTLLRRTAYVSGVHPFYIDAVSSNYARMIEQSRSISEAGDIIPYMIQNYCRLVEKRSMSTYSEPIRQILVTVDASPTADLSLKRFAKELFLNTSYLSALFKKEVGITLTDYVNRNRIECAKKLLKSTTLSVQSIATQSGLPDIHYFTRLFRREMGMSPREWRKQNPHTLD